ncbi:MAG: lysyl oxidase family protein [Bacteroidia bacterium]
MNKITSMAMLLLSLAFSSLAQTCPTGMTQIIVSITPDNYPQETSWMLQNQFGDTLRTGLANSDTVCVANGSCLLFTIFDSYGDGICCAYGLGMYQLFVNGSIQASGGQFGFQESKFINCGSGQSCTSPITISTGSQLAPTANSWYRFKPDSLGTYIISTCSASPNLDTRIWIYDNCNVPVLANDNMGTVFFNDSNTICGQRARIHAYLDTSIHYLIRIGGANNSSSIPFSISYDGPLLGCYDSMACNYDPLATVAGPCHYYPSSLCPPGPDLLVVQSAFENSLQRSVVNSSNCMVAEGCLTGHGTRTVIRFTTDIRNIGQTDYYIGNPITQPGQFNTNNCHNHAHYEGYAEYVLYPMPLNGNRIPIGFKNGFCVMDLSCPAGFSAKYGCNNMGVTAGCGDIYSHQLDCQWIDITDVVPGEYLLAIKVNWDQSPDALGRYETNYLNNWAQVCIEIYTDSAGQKQFTLLSNCQPYTDCAGTLYGTAVLDCEGVCGGSAIAGDINGDSIRNSQDVTSLLSGILQQNLSYSFCRDMSGDSTLNIWDAVLLGNCLLHSGSGSSCDFPRGLYNQNQEVNIRITQFDTIQGYLDLSISNPNNRITAFELNMNGIRPTVVLSLIPGSPAMQVLHHSGGKIMGMVVNLETSINRSTAYRPFLRVFFDRATDTAVYISQSIVMINENYESVVFTADSTRFSATPNTTSIAAPGSKPNFLIYPNPGQSNFWIQGIPQNQPISLRVYDALGREQLKLEGLNMQSGKLEFMLPALRPGMYFVVLSGEAGTGSQRLIIQ